jgi:DNA-binding transcriptional regulator YiaG
MQRAADALGVKYHTWRGWELGRAPGAAAGPLDRLLMLLEWHPELLGEFYDDD